MLLFLDPWVSVTNYPWMVNYLIFSNMRIAINGYFLTRPYTGLGNYTQGLLTAIGRLKSNHQFFVFVPEPVKVSLGDRITTQVIPPIQHIGPSIGKFWWEQWQMPKAATKCSAALIHHLYPATSILTKIPQITSIHDATPWHFPEHNYSVKVRWFRQFTLKSSQKARAVVTVSQSAKEDIARIFNIAESKIIVIYNGLDENFRKMIVEPRLKSVLAKYQINYPYIFYIGGFEIHKNTRQLFFAYASAASEIKQHLVLAGGVFSKTRPPVYRDFYELPRLIDNYKLPHRVHMIGPVPPEDLPALYQGANLFISPSLAEGFNIPLVEAMASKVPIIAANIPVNQEIAIDHAGHKGALLVNTKDAGELKRAIIKLLNNKVKQKELVANAWERQKSFGWDQAAQKLIAIYDQFEQPNSHRM